MERRWDEPEPSDEDPLATSFRGEDYPADDEDDAPVRRRGAGEPQGPGRVPVREPGVTSPYVAPSGATGGKILFGCVGVLALFGLIAWGLNAASNQFKGASAPATASVAPAAPATTVDPIGAAAAILQSEDGADGHAHPADAYATAMTTLVGQCTQDPDAIGSLVDNALADEHNNGVNDEDRLSLMQHLSQSMPSSLGKTDCVGMMAAYLVLREQ